MIAIFESKLIHSDTPHDNYDRSSELYDRLLNPFLNGIRSAFVDWAILNQPQRLLDVGCGTGKQISMLPKNMEAVGIDLSETMLAQAELQASGKCHQADATDIPFDDESFDLILSQFALHEKTTETINRELMEVKRVLQPAGVFSVVDFDYPGVHTLVSGFLKWGIHLIERQASDEHYENFKLWMKRGGLRRILSENGWEFLQEELFYKGNVRLTFWKLPN